MVTMENCNGNVQVENTEIPTERRKGTAPIKPEFLKKALTSDENAPPPEKRSHPEETTNDEKGKRKKGVKGQNKARPKTKSQDQVRLCREMPNCSREACTFSHDPKEYLAAKGPDIGPVCRLFELYGKCRYGITCRFASSHTNEQLESIEREDAPLVQEEQVLNVVQRDFQKSIRSKQVQFPRTDEFYKVVNQVKQQQSLEATVPSVEATTTTSTPTDTTTVTTTTATSTDDTTNIAATDTSETHAAKLEKMVNLESEMVRIPTREKKTIDFRGKTYLAPLTTVGNLPFRRVCKGFGVDVTCGEMAMQSSLLSGQQSEWALMRRHKSEDLFGVQIAGSSPYLVTKTAELINQQCQVDFVDLNCGCPIDLVFRTGAGSALMDRQSKLTEMVQGMNYVLDCPVTVKIRTGILDNKPNGLKIINRLKAAGANLVTMHGRSRQQRYTKLADWDYIADCASKTVDDSFQMFGNGDVLSHIDYYNHLENTAVSGIMIGRGALIKPWIFTEIKEKRVWDISSHERFEMLKDFADYGLEHWGSDTQGVNQTRRFMCEALSFLHRYIPVGLLEVLPQHINDRPPPYFGRDELETLMASPLASDWVKLSERILGPAPEDFHFVPKHKSNSYEIQG